MDPAARAGQLLALAASSEKPEEAASAARRAREHVERHDLVFATREEVEWARRLRAGLPSEGVFLTHAEYERLLSTSDRRRRAPPADVARTVGDAIGDVASSLVQGLARRRR